MCVCDVGHLVAGAASAATSAGVLCGLAFIHSLECVDGKVDMFSFRIFTSSFAAVCFAVCLTLSWFATFCFAWKHTKAKSYKTNRKPQTGDVNHEMHQAFSLGVFALSALGLAAYGFVMVASKFSVACGNEASVPLLILSSGFVTHGVHSLLWSAFHTGAAKALSDHMLELPKPEV